MPAGLVAPGMGCPGRGGALDLVWMLQASDLPELHWVGLFLVGCPACSSGHLAATGREENPANEVAALVWSAMGVTGALLVALIVQDNGEQTAGWVALALHGAGVYALGRWTPRFQYAAALAPALSLAALVLWWLEVMYLPAAWQEGRFAWLAVGFGGLYAAGASPCCGMQHGQASGRPCRWRQRCRISW